jgi:uncharacterized protein (PEP-CTERM system associated)
MATTAAERRTARRLAHATLTAAVIAFAQAAPAQVPEPPPVAPLPMTLRTTIISPQISFRETWSDNVTLAPDASARSGWITDVTPGLRIEHTGARVRAFLDYRLHSLYYSNDSNLDKRQQFLDAAATIEAVEQRVFIDGIATITNQRRTPFGAAVAPDSAGADNNRVETRAVQFAPYVRGEIRDIAVYQARVNATHLSAEDDSFPRTRVIEFAGRMRNPSPSARLGWWLDASILGVSNDAIDDRHDRRLRAAAVVGPTPQLHLSAIVGYEATDFTFSGERRDGTYGAGVEWSPSVRTQVAGVAEKRFFGWGHSVALRHRTARTAWRFASYRDVALFPGLLPATRAGNVTSLLDDLLASAIPDPLERSVAARRRLEATGIPASSALATGFITDRPSLERRHEASFALQGVRSTVILGWLRRDQAPIAPSLGFPSLVAITAPIREQGFNADWAYRLTPLSTFTLAATALTSEETSGTQRESRTRAVSATISSRLSPRTNVSLGVRHVRFDGTGGPAGYTENAVAANLNWRP